MTSSAKIPNFPSQPVAARVMKRRRRERLQVLSAGDERADGFSIKTRPGRPPTITWQLHEDPLVSLLSFDAVLDELETVAVQLVMHARSQDFSWADVGLALNVTRQSAQARYGFVDKLLDGTLVIGPDGTLAAP